MTLDGIDDYDLDRKAHHSKPGIVMLRGLLDEWAGHDTLHIAQPERALSQAFIPGSGPWRRYFADHDVVAPPGRDADGWLDQAATRSIRRSRS